MFDDIIKPEPVKTEKDSKLYICQYADKCDEFEFCLHKFPHGKLDLGRPENGPGDDNSDCSIEVCKNSKFKDAVCVPVKQ